MKKTTRFVGTQYTTKNEKYCALKTPNNFTIEKELTEI